MAHNLKTNQDGKKAMIYTGPTPWHGLGTACPDSFHAAEAMKAFPFTYRKEPLYRSIGGQFVKETDKIAIVISDTNKTVGYASPDYGLVQPTDAFTFMDSISEMGQLLYETVGAIGDGERIWCMARMPEYIFEVVKNDPIKQHLLFTTSYDGGGSNEARGISTRVVCENTLNSAINEARAFISIRHTKNALSRLNMAAEIMKGYERQCRSFKEAMQELVKHPINDRLIKEFEIEMFGDPTKVEPDSRSETILKNKTKKFEELLVTGKGTDIKGVVGTLYGMVNAYTEWSDWHSTVRGTTDRTNAILFGQASKEKTKALELALVMAR